MSETPAISPASAPDSPARRLTIDLAIVAELTGRAEPGARRAARS